MYLRKTSSPTHSITRKRMRMTRKEEMMKRMTRKEEMMKRMTRKEEMMKRMST